MMRAYEKLLGGLKPIVTDTYDFPTLIRRGYVYVDKTVLLHRLVSGVDGLMFFMSRPRRFGKSLMISTLEQIFKGERKLFSGLEIAKTDYDWVKYPIIRLDMTAFDHTSGLSAFKRALAHELGGKEPIAAFRSLIERKARSSRGKGVVVLIDEYDSPVSGLLGRPSELDAMREFLQTFYRIIKQEAAAIRFMMMTGVSKFTKLSVFSGLNNLTDLTMDPVYAGLLGYTPEELTAYLGGHIESVAKGSGRSSAAIVEQLLDWYDSYRFSPKSETRVCNPVSVGLALKSGFFEAYWNRTGSSALIIEHLAKHGKLPIDVECVKISAKRLDVCDLHELPIESLMYQGGYLTIKSVAADGDLVLGLPNKEVREAVYGGFLDGVLRRRSDDFSSCARDVAALLDADSVDAKALRDLLTSVFAMVPHEWKFKNEAEAKRYFLLFMKLAGADIIPEFESAHGRADAVLQTTRTVCIFEFKYGKSTKLALRQIAEKGYAKPYAGDKRMIVTIGINYNPKTAELEINVPVNVPVKCSTVTLVEQMIRQNPGVNRKRLSAMCGLTEKTIGRQVKLLVGKVEFRGAPKTGGYYCK